MFTRTINYKVEQQVLSTTDDLKDIYEGSNHYLELLFEFDENWDDCAKVIVYVMDNGEWPILLTNNRCSVPCNVIQNRFIRFYLVGKRSDGYRITTNSTRIGVKKHGWY